MSKCRRSRNRQKGNKIALRTRGIDWLLYHLKSLKNFSFSVLKVNDFSLSGELGEM